MIPQSISRRFQLRSLMLALVVLGSLVAHPVAAGPLDCLVEGVGDRCEEWSRAYDEPSARGGPAGQTGRNDASAVLVSPSGDRVFLVGEVRTGSNQTLTRVWAVDPASGDERWVATYGGPGGNNFFTHDAVLSMDGSRLFVTGSSRADLTNSDSDATTAAFDTATGERLWVASFDGPGEPFGIDMDWGKSVRPSPDDEHVYVAVGSHGATQTGSDIQTLAYDADSGEVVWSVRYAPPDLQQPAALAVTPDGKRVVVVGYGEGDGTTGGAVDKWDYDWVVIAYETGRGTGTEGGEEAWSAPFDAPERHYSYDGASGIVMDPNGERAYVVGQSGDTSTRSDFTTLALDLDTGAVQWEARYRPDGPAGIGLTGMPRAALDADGRRLFITGRGQRQANGYNWDMVTAAFDAETGMLLWADSYDYLGNIEAGRAISVAPDGQEVFVSGWYDTFITVAYGAGTGIRRWTARFDSSSGNTDSVSANAISPDGTRLFVAGEFAYHESGSAQAEAGNNSDAGLVAYDLLNGSSPTPTPTPTATPTPTSTPTPTLTPTPDPSPTEGGGRGFYPETPNDPYFGEDSPGPITFEPTQWALRKVQATQAWQQLRATGLGIRVAVLDSGVDLQHEDLQCAGKLDVGAGSDVVANDSDPDDENGHGTHVAGIIGACTNNGTGVAGVAPDATIVPVRVLNASGNGTDAQLIVGLDKATELGVHVVNLSLGYPPGKQVINDVSGIGAAIDRAQHAGVVLVAAAGNDSFPLCEYPALAEGIICVGATDARDQKAAYSVFPNKTDAENTVGPGLVAPGGSSAPFCDTYAENILSTIPLELDTDGCTDVQGYANNSGTSMAAPHVAGAAALIYDRLGGERSEAAAAEVIGAIIDNADDLGVPGYDPVFGWGRLNVSRAVQAISVGPDPTTSPSPTPTGSPSPTPSESPAPDTTEVSFAPNSATSGQYSDESLFEARLIDSNGDPLGGRELSFELTGAESSRKFTAMTDSDGLASVTPTLEEKPGPHQLTVRFTGDDDHAGDADTMSFVVEREDTTLDLSETKGKDKALVAHLYDVDTPTDGIAGRTIEFYSDGELIGSAETDADGVASVALPPRHRGYNRTYEAVFEGDDFYLGASDDRPGKDTKAARCSGSLNPRPCA